MKDGTPTILYTKETRLDHSGSRREPSDPVPCGSRIHMREPSREPSRDSFG
jgi:hypothetical protein